MQIKFRPNFTITPAIARDLVRIEAAKGEANHMPLTAHVLSSLRESMRLKSAHYSTMIEGNRLSLAEVEHVIARGKTIPGKKRDVREVNGYDCAMQHVKQWAARKRCVTQKLIQTLHALVMAGGQSHVQPSPYRDGQNVIRRRPAAMPDFAQYTQCSDEAKMGANFIRNSSDRAIVYLPPEAHDVPGLMAGLVYWMANTKNLPQPLVAAIAHYQFATIHPYYDGNGRTARLLATLLLYLGGYDLRSLYALEEYYGQDLDAYYRALSIGPSHNYYEGRAHADITPWIAYFIDGMATSFESAVQQMRREQKRGISDQSAVLRSLDFRQKKVLELFEHADTITARHVGELFGFRPRTSAHMCSTWAAQGFLEIANASNKGRTYKLAIKFKKLI
jgi:Fic family protein